MFNPSHPSLTLRNDVLSALGLNGHAVISPEMAFHLEAWRGKERGGDAGV
jgi:hypothetical protein